MSADKINIAIAKWLGWKFDWVCWFDPGGKMHSDCPNFCGDLNAMALAEANVPYDIQPYLLRELKRSVMNYETGVSEWDCYVATALQRAQALVKTLSLPIE